MIGAIFIKLERAPDEFRIYAEDLIAFMVKPLHGK